MPVMYQVILIINLVLFVIQLGVVYLLARFLGDFMKEIRAIGSIQLGRLGIGDEAPLFRELNSRNQKVSLKDLITEKKVLLFFVNSHCPTCKSIIPQLNKIIDSLDLHVLVINTNNAADDSEIRQLLPSECQYIQSPEIAKTYFISRVPTAFLINREGQIEQFAPINQFNELLNLLINVERKSDQQLLQSSLSVL